MGLIRLIDERALDLVCEALIATPDLRLSFNISGETVGDEEWLAQLTRHVDGRRDLTERMIVEITETALMHNLDEATGFVASLHDLGCKVALDDFGAGFSSFKSLRELGVDLVKIDGGFVVNLTRSHDDQAFVRALVDLAHNLGIETVAESVENEDSATILAAWGVDYLQGHLIGEAKVDWAASPVVEAG